MNSSKEGGKVLNQLIEALLKPTEDVPRYICVLQHLCWLSEQVSESEIVCPIVEYATQLIPQLQQMWKRVQALREAHLDCSNDSDSDADNYNACDSATKKRSSNTVDISKRLSFSQIHAQEQARKPKSLNFRTVMRAIELKIANDSTNPQLEQSNTTSTEKAAPATVECSPRSAASPRAAQSDSDSDAPHLELQDIASSPSLAACDDDSDAEVSLRLKDNIFCFGGIA
jgi:hypothetical protein